MAEVLSFVDDLLPTQTLFFLLHLTSCFAPFIITRGLNEVVAQMTYSGGQSPKTTRQQILLVEAASENMNFPILVPFYEKIQDYNASLTSKN